MKILKICLVISVLFVVQRGLVAADNNNNKIYAQNEYYKDLKAAIEKEDENSVKGLLTNEAEFNKLGERRKTDLFDLASEHLYKITNHQLFADLKAKESSGKKYYCGLKDAIKHQRKDETIKLLNQEDEEDKFAYFTLAAKTELFLLVIEHLPELANHEVFNEHVKSNALSQAAHEENHLLCKNLIEDHNIPVNVCCISNAKNNYLKSYLLRTASSTVKFEYALHYKNVGSIQTLIENPKDIVLNQEMQNDFVLLCINTKDLSLLQLAHSRGMRPTLRNQQKIIEIISQITANIFEFLLKNDFLEINNDLRDLVAQETPDFFQTLVDMAKKLNKDLKIDSWFMRQVKKENREQIINCLSQEQKQQLFANAISYSEMKFHLDSSTHILEILQKANFTRDTTIQDANRDFLNILRAKDIIPKQVIFFATEEEIRKAFLYQAQTTPNVANVKILAESGKVDFKQPIQDENGKDFYTRLEDATQYSKESEKQQYTDVFDYLVKEKDLKQDPVEAKKKEEAEEKKRLANLTHNQNTTSSNTSTQYKSGNILSDQEMRYVLIGGSALTTVLVAYGIYHYFLKPKEDHTQKPWFTNTTAVAAN